MFEYPTKSGGVGSGYCSLPHPQLMKFQNIEYSGIELLEIACIQLGRIESFRPRATTGSPRICSVYGPDDVRLETFLAVYGAEDLFR